MKHYHPRQWALAACIAMACAVAPARGEIAEDRVLVVYNSASADGAALKDAYLAAHPGIPASNVLALNDASLLVADLSPADFVSKVRDPIRAFLSAAGYPDPSDIIAIVLIRPFPHRVLDSDNALVGDNPTAAGTEFLPPSSGGQGDATFASVDAELVLLWQDLYGGEAGDTMDSLSDDVIDNPYHQGVLPIDSYSRSSIATAKTFTNTSNVAWTLSGSGSTKLKPGDLYLVCRVDGATHAAAAASIARAQRIHASRGVARVILDEFDLSTGADLDDDALFATGDPFNAGDDYEETTAILLADGWDVRYDDMFDFISSSEEPSPLIAYASYGENHDLSGRGEDPPGTGTYISGFQFVPGAMFNTVESYNGRALNGLGTLFGQEQAADFIAAGGTFAIGMVFEPLSFSIPDNEFLFVNMLVRGMQWGEAAYTSLPVLSWQHVVLGDPLAWIGVLGDLDLDRDADLSDYALLSGCLRGPGFTSPPAGCPTALFDEADLDGDQDVDLADFAEFQRALDLF
ncbi:MAG: hypothetical protein JXB13_07335 [Phycisphaerae bacterium]|nr:hypothetical protein [Phycisphaerae bacterium]